MDGQPNGLEWDTQTGGLWISDKTMSRTVLRDPDTGTARKVVNSPRPDVPGCLGDRVGDRPPHPVFGEPNLHSCSAEGSIGVDVDGNVWLTGGGAYQGAFRYPAPIPTPAPGGPPYLNHSWDVSLLAKPLDEEVGNRMGLRGVSLLHGVAVAGQQLIVADGFRLLFWNDRRHLADGQPADGVVGQARPDKSSPWGTGYGHFVQLSVDGRGRLWAAKVTNVLVYDTPLRAGATPIRTFSGWPADPENVTLRLLGGGPPMEFNSWSVAPIGDGSAFWLADMGGRVLRVRNAFAEPVVDLVLGQRNGTMRTCNGAASGVSDDRAVPGAATLCHPRTVALHPGGDLFVTDGGPEAGMNRRMVRFDADDLPAAPARPVFGLPEIPARQVYGQRDFAAREGCAGVGVGHNPLSVAFDDLGRAVVVDYCSWRAHLYRDPLTSSVPDATLPTPLHAAGAVTVTPEGDWIIADDNWHRLLFFHGPW
jgi:hypothetical protein